MSGARAASAQGAIAPEGSNASLERLVGRAGGLRADDVAARAVATSPDVRRHQAEIAEATADLDRALIAFIPRFSASVEYARLSSVGSQSIGGYPLTERPGGRGRRGRRGGCGRLKATARPRSHAIVSSFIGANSPATMGFHPFSTPTMPRFPWHRRTSDPQGASPVETRARSTKAIRGGRRASALGDPGDLQFPSNPATYGVTSCPPRGRSRRTNQ
jgi:hypothetical protein